MELKIDIDTKELERKFAHLGKQAPYAMIATINKLAYDDVKPAFAAEMNAKLDRPTKFTLNSVRVKPAKKSKPYAHIYIRDEAHKGTAPAQYLAPNAAGDDPYLKRSERLLRRRGVLKPNQRLIPGRRTKLNQYGNWSGAQMNKALSNIGHQSDRYQNTNRKTRKRKTQNRYDYFLIPNGHPRLTPGIWKEERGWAYPWVVFADNVKARRAVLNFQKISNRVVKYNMNRRARYAMEKALATAYK